MGIINLAIQNRALLTKHLHKFYNKANIPWVSLIWDTYYNSLVPHATVQCGSFWWRDIMKINDVYRENSIVIVNSGDTALFWHDSWILNACSNPVKERFPRLVSFTLDDKISVRDFIQDLDIEAQFQLPLSPEAMDELQTLQLDIQGLERDPNAPDSWSWTPGKGVFLPIATMCSCTPLCLMMILANGSGKVNAP